MEQRRRGIGSLISAVNELSRHITLALFSLPSALSGSPSIDTMSERKAVKLISAEGYEFIVDHDAACVSNTIKNMLSSQGALCADRHGCAP